MSPPQVPRDTDPAMCALQIERLRAMTVGERFDLIDAIHADVEALALAGIRRDHPGLDDRGVRHELARRRYGSDLADAAYTPSDP